MARHPWDPSSTRAASADTCTSDDLVAVSLLSVTVPAQAAHELLVRQRARFETLLAEVGPDRDLVGVEEPIDETWPAWVLSSALRELPDVGPTTAIKLLARKRPRLVPVFDSVINDHVLGGSGVQWVPFRSALQAERGRLHRRLLDLRTAAGLDEPVGWLRCLGGAPSTWILKIAHPETSPVADVVDTEALALALARSLGLTTVDAHVLSVDGVRAIAVSRYDRKAEENGRIRRVHQEDSAQALDINTADPTRKFQYGNALPSLSAIAEILRAGGAEPDELLRLVTFNVAIGNTDMHAKNISVLRLPDGSARLAPAYDTSMHLHHPTSQRRFGFDIDGESDLDRIDTRALVAEGRSWRLPERRATELVTSTLEGLGRALSEVDRAAHPGVSDGAVETVAARVSSLLAGALTVVPAVRARRGPRRRST